MKTFKNYSKYYDFLYGDKDYQKEFGFVYRCIKKFKKNGNQLLSLGCGTANYEIFFAKEGFDVTGIDISEDMLEIAKVKVTKAGLKDKIILIKSDVRNIKLNTRFDIVVELFNVLGYQNLNEDLDKNLKEVSRLLKKGGLFLFDCWYMPAVLKDGPVDKVKEVKTENGRIIRKTHSSIFPTEDIVEVNFEVTEFKNKKTIGKALETHKIRYFSIPELTYFLSQNSMQIVKILNFMDEKGEVRDDKWNIFVIAKKV